MTEIESPAEPSLVAIDTGWRTAPCAAVVADTTGTIRAINDIGARLFPDARAGAPLSGTTTWLADAHRDAQDNTALGVDQIVQGRVDDRSFEAHAVHHPDDTTTWWLIDNTAEGALRVERRRTAFLGEASHALLASLDVDRCMETAVRLAAGHLADAALVIAPPSRRRLPAVSCVRDGVPVRARFDADPDELPGLSEALQGFPPVPARWIDPSSAPAWLLPDGFAEVGSVMVIPLPGHGVPAGALILMGRTANTAFTDHDEVLAGLFAARCGAAMSAAWMFAQQASITDTLMRELLPPVLHQVAGVEFAGRYHASRDSERVGGDFYDVHASDADEGTDFATDQTESLAVLGDVCGKGLDAAVMTGKIRNTVHALLPMADDHQRLLSLLNGSLVNAHSTRFVTMVLASATRDGSDVRLRITCAGHPPPLIVRASGQVEAADSQGNLIGVLPEVESSTAELVLAPGETCLLYTDGITEARGGPLGDDMFGEDRLRKALGACAGMPADAVAEHVHMLAAQWVGRACHDDMAVLAITAPRGQHLTAVGGHGRGRYTA